MSDADDVLLPDTGDATVSDADDATVLDEAPLWRRIPKWHVIWDENLGRNRPTSAAFEDHPNGTPMSVILGNDVLESGRSPDSVLEGHDGFSLASIPAGLARKHGQIIMRKPLADEPAHAEVSGKKTNSVKKSLAKACEWVIPPPSES